MRARKFFNNKFAIMFAGVLLASYLGLILTVTNLGQQKLKESQHNELHLKVNHYVDTLSYFFTVTQHNLEVLSEDKTISTFFANRNSGMSMTYGLAASLFKVEQLLKQYADEKQIAHLATFNNIALFSLDGELISKRNEVPQLTIPISYLQLAKHQAQHYKIEQQESEITIKLLQTVYLHNRPIALIVAEINNQVLVKQLTAQEYLGSGSRIKLESAFGTLDIWDSLNLSHSDIPRREHLDVNNTFYINEHVLNTPFSISTWFEAQNEQQLFTSRWFIIVLSIFAVPVFIGLYYLIRAERSKVIFQTEISLAQQQQEQLLEHNEQLQKEVKRRKSSESKLAYRATHDALTGLANRAHSTQQLQHAIELSKRSHKDILVIFIDLDNFKQINDTMGHCAGDQILIDASKRLLKTVRKTDTVARQGGDEFLLIIPDIEDHQQASVIAMKLLSLFEPPFNYEGQDFFTSASLGLAFYPHDGETPDALLKSADMALYRVKDSGRNDFGFYDKKMNDEVMRNMNIIHRLHHAIETNSLEMYYQPVIDLKTQKIVGAEALMRWFDDELGFVPPDEFIPLAERNGLIHHLGEFALQEACSQMAEWQAIAPIHVAVNFSSVQFRDCSALLAQIKSILNSTGLPPDKLDVEVTESLLIHQEGELAEMLKELRSLSIQLSIDDFGTGYSALSYLQKFSFTKLKIDRAFIMNLSNNMADRSLVTAMLAMAKALGLEVIAEGIEEPEHMEFLQQQECEYGQGYLFSKPVNAPDFELLLKAHIKEQASLNS